MSLERSTLADWAGARRLCYNPWPTRSCPLTLGRRNWTFVGSDAGGDRAAVFFTLTQTCRLNGVNEGHYLTDVIARIADHPANCIEELLPWNWKPLAEDNPPAE